MAWLAEKITHSVTDNREGRNTDRELISFLKLGPLPRLTVPRETSV